MDYNCGFLEVGLDVLDLVFLFANPPSYAGHDRSWNFSPSIIPAYYH